MYYYIVFKCKESEEELFYVFKNIFSAVQKLYTIQITQKTHPWHLFLRRLHKYKYLNILGYNI